ncbi:hypothetical protein BJ742DRAFT_773228 [Cladochytrium replicatum]|nr:hypothetical protein BJ742DRAFT_773228 [Cladochytrium replicatum]
MSSLHAIPLEFLIPSSIAFIISTLALIGVSLHAKVFNGAFNKGFRFLVPLNLMASDIIALVNIIVKQNQSTLLATITTSMDLVTFTAGLCYTLSFYYGMHKEDRRMSIGLTPIQLSYVLIGAQVFIGSATFVALWYFRYGPNGCETCGREVPLQVVAVMFTVLVEFYHDAKALIEIYQAKKKALSRKGYHERRTSEDNAPASLSLGRTRTLLLSLISINVAIVLAFSVVVFIFLNQPAVLRIVSGLTHPAIRIVIFNVIIFIFGVFKLMKLTEAKVGTAKLAQLPFPQTRRPYSNTDSSSGSQISAGNIEISDAQQLSPPFPRGAMYFTPHELQGVSSIGSNTEEPGLPLATPPLLLDLPDGATQAFRIATHLRPRYVYSLLFSSIPPFSIDKGRANGYVDLLNLHIASSVLSNYSNLAIDLRQQQRPH